MRVGLAVLQVPWRAPLAAAHSAAASTRPLLLLELTADDGVRGYGEAAPLEGYDGVSLEEVAAALRRCEPLLAASDGEDRERLLADCAALAGLPEALAAVDMALWDLAGRRAGQPVSSLLGAGAEAAVAVNATIGAERPSQAAVDAAAAAAAGFGCVKVKVATGEDERRVAAVREAVGTGVLIRVDANGGWTVPAAVDSLQPLREHGLELCEEPVHGLDEISAVADAVAVPVAVDESARDPDVFARRRCDAICLKIARCGGISGLVRDAATARAAGYDVYISSTLDGPLGISAALHAAAAVLPDRHCGLATLARFDAPDPVPPRDGMMSPPPGPGLGDDLVGWYDRALTAARPQPPGSRDAPRGRRRGSA